MMFYKVMVYRFADFIWF